MKKYMATIYSPSTTHKWQLLKSKTLKGAKVEATRLLEPSAFIGDELRLVEMDRDERRSPNDLPYWRKKVTPEGGKWELIA